MPTRNPYSSGSWFPDMSPTINNFVDNLTRLKMHQGDIDMRGRALQETERQHREMLPIQQGNLDVSRGQLDVQRGNLAVQQEEAARKPPLPAFQQVLDPAEVLAKKVSFNIAFGEGSSEVFAPLFETMDQIASANPKTTKWDAFEGSKAAYPGQRDDLIANAEKYIAGPKFAKLKPAQKEAFIQLFNAIKYDLTGDEIYDNWIFKGTVASKKMADAQLKQVGMDQVKAAISIKAMRGEVLTEDEKALVGIRPERPSSVAPGGSLVDPQTGIPIYTNPNRPESNRPISVAPGGVAIDPQTGIPIYTSPNRPESDRPVSVAPGGMLVSPKTGVPIYKAPGAGPSETELRAQRNELAVNETKLLQNKTNEGAAPLADLHNERSEKPYAYVWKDNSRYIPGTDQKVWDSGEYVQIKLPKIKGKQVTAKDVYDTASKRGMTYEEVLRAIGALK